MKYILIGLIIIIGIFGIFFIRGKPWFSDFNPHELLVNYTEDEINHFSFFAFQEGSVRKWKNDIRLKIGDKYAVKKDFLRSIISCIDQINSETNEIYISIVEHDPNVNIALLENITPGYLGYTNLDYDSYEIPYPIIKSGEIVVKVETNELSRINSTIYHEFTHLLGFHHNFNKYQESDWTYKSLFNQTTMTFDDTIGELVEDFTEYSDLDKAAIRIMYDADVAIDPGLTKEKFFRLIEKAKKEMEE